MYVFECKNMFDNWFGRNKEADFVGRLIQQLLLLLKDVSMCKMRIHCFTDPKRLLEEIQRTHGGPLFPCIQKLGN